MHKIIDEVENPYQQVNGSPVFDHQSPRPRIIYCVRCNGPFADYEDMACTGRDEYWHLECFVCAQCFRPFNQDLEYYDFMGRKYCEKDFRTLFAPCCARCNRFVIGRFLRALNKCWHPGCLLCDSCSTPLADMGLIKTRNNKILCHACNLLDKAVSKNMHTCDKCKAIIEDEDGPALHHKDKTYHAYHFNCNSCGIELRPDARLVHGDLHCLKCHDRLNIPTCGACRRPIEERIVTALGKHWHVEHFSCATCEKPFLGKRHYEAKGLAYCERDYYKLFGHHCHVCQQVIQGEFVCALDKFYCPNHFRCYYCDEQFPANKTKFFNVTSNPCCKKCYRRFPGSFRRQLVEQQKLEKKVKNGRAKL